jgi:DNA-binding response OmpR family regulator
MERILKSIDSAIEFDWATSAETAVEHLRETLVDSHSFPYDLIIADIFLDGPATGIDFWRTCQEMFPNTPILLTSGLSLDRFFTTIGRESISPPYLQKPFAPGECKQVLEGMLGYASKKNWKMNPRKQWLS